MGAMKLASMIALALIAAANPALAFAGFLVATIDAMRLMLRS